MKRVEITKKSSWSYTIVVYIHGKITSIYKTRYFSYYSNSIIHEKGSFGINRLLDELIINGYQKLKKDMRLIENR